MISIVVPCFNAEDYVRQCISSIQCQSYTDYKAVVVDDCSTDQTHKSCQEAIAGDSRFQLIQSQENSGPLASIMLGIKHLAPPSERILAIVDGDDYLCNHLAFDIVLHTYKRTRCWVTYGSFLTSSGAVINPHIGKRYDVETISDNAFRRAPWRASHLKTFKAHVCMKIRDADLRNPMGKYWPVTGDMALMFPILEMAGERQEAIPDYIYHYRDNLCSNEHMLRPSEQYKIDQLLRAMAPYQPL